MNTSNWVILAAVIGVAGRWARGQNLDVPSVVAMFIVAFAVTLLGTVNEELAAAMAMLIMFAMAYSYIPDILAKVAPAMTKVGGR